ncbi:MAG: NAD-dependent epimerase/dehydratase family protein [Cellvibrionales bacterium]|nr:NAD-dependent epimerase/dehydratase family protein [Cellvibrionales bacterium]
MVNVLVTGASGYIGRHLCQTLLKAGFVVFPVVRDINKGFASIPKEQHVVISNCHAQTDWSPFLKDIEVVIHLMARAHKPAKTDDEHQFNFQNVDLFESLINHSMACGIKQILFLSSIGVNGEKTSGKPFTVVDSPSPKSNYAKSKWAAEQLLERRLKNSDTTFTTIRPPLVYHGDKSGYKGNLRLLEKLIATKLPLPLGNIQNRRSLVSVQNLTSLIDHCIQNPKAYNQTFLVSDPEPVSTSQLLRLMSGGEVRLFSLPKWFFKLGFRLIGKPFMVDKLFASLEVDSLETQNRLNWQAPFTVETIFKDKNG